MRPGVDNISFELNISDPQATHILTVFRTAKHNVTMAVSATDANGKPIIAENITLEDHASGRRLSLWSSLARRLSTFSRRRSGGSSSSSGGGWSSRRRSQTSDSRRRGSPTQPLIPPTSTRRRTTTTHPSSTRRRTTSQFSPNKPWSNHNGHGGNYGYANHNQAMSNYGGKLPTQTGYGYSGSGALGSGAKIALALGGGMLVGALGAHLLGQLAPSFPHIHNPLDLNCTHGSWFGVCRDCVGRFQAANCDAQLPVSVDIVRDDLMTSGFVPNDFVGPITVTITGLSGTDFDPMQVCPPLGWNEDLNVPAWAPPNNATMILSLTEMSSVNAHANDVPSNSGSETANVVSKAAHGLAGFLVLLCCGVSCCVMICCGARQLFSQKKQDHEYSDSSTDSEPGPYQIPPQHMAPSAPYASQTPYGTQYPYGGGPVVHPVPDYQGYQGYQPGRILGTYPGEASHVQQGVIIPSGHVAAAPHW